MNGDRLPFFLALAAVALCSTVAPAQSTHLIAQPVRPPVDASVRVTLLGGTPFALDGAGGGSRPGTVSRLWRSGRVDLGVGAPVTFRAVDAGVQVLSSSTFDPRHALWSFAKALVVVGDAPVGGQIWRSKVGQRLEIVPESDPVVLARRGGTLDARIVLDRGPLEGVPVVAVADTEPPGHRRGVTDRDGRVTLELDRPGRWLVQVAHKDLDGAAAELLASSLSLVAGSD